jgi:hypothetical protein
MAPACVIVISAKALSFHSDLHPFHLRTSTRPPDHEPPPKYQHQDHPRGHRGGYHRCLLSAEGTHAASPSRRAWAPGSKKIHSLIITAYVKVILEY